MFNREIRIKILKIAIGSALAIFFAELIGLEYATSAGVITLLTIQNTRQKTLELATIRLLSLSVTIFLASVLCYYMTMPASAFGLFMLFLVTMSYQFGWVDALSVNTVIGAQILVLKNGITVDFAINEAMLVFIGIGIAAFFNLWMPDQKREIEAEIFRIETVMKEIMTEISAHFQFQEALKEDKSHIVGLLKDIEKATDMALDNKDNTLLAHSQYYVEYLNMRKNQCLILLQINRSCRHVEMLPEQSGIMAPFIEKMAQKLHEKTDVRVMCEELEAMIECIEEGDLPATQREFESFAALFHLLKELEEFLRLKRAFVKNLTQEQIRIYWEA